MVSYKYVQGRWTAVGSSEEHCTTRCCWGPWASEREEEIKDGARRGAVVSPNTHLPALSFGWNLSFDNDTLFANPISQSCFEAMDFKISRSLPSLWGSFGLLSINEWPSRNELTFPVSFLGSWARLAVRWAVEDAFLAFLAPAKSAQIQWACRSARCWPPLYQHAEQGLLSPTEMMTYLRRSLAISWE